MTTLTVKTKTGASMDYVFAEIIAVDGRPYEDSGEVRDVLNQMQGQLDTLMAIVAGNQQKAEGPFTVEPVRSYAVPVPTDIRVLEPNYKAPESTDTY